MVGLMADRAIELEDRGYVVLNTTEGEIDRTSMCCCVFNWCTELGGVIGV